MAALRSTGRTDEGPEMTVCVTEQPNHLFSRDTMAEIYVKVSPDEDEFEIEMKHIPEIKLEEKAENGRANLELVRKLENILGEKPGIISGHRSKRKKLKIPMEEDEIRKRMKQHG